LTHAHGSALRFSAIVAAALFMFAALAGQAGAAPKAKGKPVAVYPVAKTQYISDRSSISFRGINPKKVKINRIRVVGKKTGRHAGRKLVHSDRKGFSWVPKKRFKRGEKVRVTTNLRIVGAKRGDWNYRVARLTAKDDKPVDPVVPPATDGLRSRPDLRPTELNVETNLPEKTPGAIFYAAKQNGLAIADEQGRTTWFRDFNYDATGITLYNFRVQEYRDRPVLTYWKGASSLLGYSQIGTFEILNRRYERIASVTPGNGYKADIHEFQLTDRDTALVLSYVGVRKDLRKAGGVKKGKILDNVVQEIDIKTGAVLFEWHSLGNVPFTTGVGQVPKDSKSSFDYFHANSIQVDGNSYLVSGRRHSSIYRIDARTGKIRWTLAGSSLPGNAKGSFVMGPGTEFGYQHDAQRLPNGDISLFDNALGRFEPEVRNQSSALVLRLGVENGKRTATLVKRYEHPDAVVAQSQGNALPLSNGGFFVGWGQVNRMTEFNAEGDVVFDATHTGDQSESFGVISSYRAFKGAWNGVPSGKPAIASQAAGAGATVWASWNGSQAVRQWRVLTGPDANGLAPATTVPWTGLETEIDVPAAGATLQVQALNGAGEVIGESAAVPVGTQDSGQK
jgi:hypothetical protein